MFLFPRNFSDLIALPLAPTYLPYIQKKQEASDHSCVKYVKKNKSDSTQSAQIMNEDEENEPDSECRLLLRIKVEVAFWSVGLTCDFVYVLNSRFVISWGTTTGVEGLP